jgi:hypothetical protein
VSNLNTIENVLPVVEEVLENVQKYTGYTHSFGYFEHASFDKGGKNKFTIFGHNGDALEIWYLNKPLDRSDLMTRTFLWYDVVKVNKQ